MAQHNRPVPAEQWTLLTDSDVTRIRVQNQSGYSMFLQRSDTNEPPSLEAGWAEVLPRAFVLNELIDDLWPGAPGGRVWAWSKHGGSASVSYA